MKPSESAEAVEFLLAAYPNARVTQATVEIYESMLADLDFEQTKRAVVSLVGTCKFLPSIAEIRKIVRSDFANERFA